MSKRRFFPIRAMIFGMLLVVLLAGCTERDAATAVSTPPAEQPGSISEHDADAENAPDAPAAVLALPPLSAAPLDGERLRVVATTSLIGDVVAQVGGDAIQLTILMNAGQDPHAYEPAARQLTAVSDAHVIFVNGWNLEEGLVDNLAAIGSTATFVPISANVTPRPFGGHDDDHDEEMHAEEHDHAGVDPHVWFDLRNVAQWTRNAAQVLAARDPANAATYEQNAAAYLAALDDLERYAAAQFAAIPADRRLLVTNHDSLGYLAAAYNFEILGTVIPGASTLAEPSARELAALIELMDAYAICTIFTETTVSESLARTAASELQNCSQVQVISLYTGAIGPAGSGADSLIGMFRANVNAIVEGLR